MNEDGRPADPLDRPAELGELWRLRREGFLCQEGWEAARHLVLPGAIWRAWASRHLLYLGTALILAGVIYFFAYNWEDMDRLTKLGLAAGGVVLSAGAAYWVGLTKLGGKVLLLAASVMVGVLLAVFGQVYQTGADAYELFLSWAALIFLWVLISDFAALWFAWILILDLAVLFYWGQVAEPEGWTFELYFLGLSLPHALALGLREVLLGRDRERLPGSWLRLMLLLLFLTFTTMPTLAWIFDDSARFLWFLSPALWLLGIVAVYTLYRFRLRDPVALTLVVLDACLVLCCFLIHGIFEGLDLHEEAGALLSGITILVVVGVAAFGLKHWIGQMADGLDERSGEGGRV